MLERLWRIMNTNFVLLLTGFFLTTVLGVYLNSLFQRSTWEREKRFQVLSFKLEEETKYVERLTSLMQRRCWRLQRVLWAIESGDESKTGQLWNDYYESVSEWNEQLGSNFSRLKRLAGIQMAHYFMLPGDEVNEDRPNSIHGKLRLAHDRTLEAKKCLMSGSPSLQQKLLDAQNALADANANVYRLVDLLTNEFSELERQRAEIR